MVKYRGTHQAEVSLAERGDAVYLVIRDAGRGFEARKRTTGLGSSACANVSGSSVEP